MGGYLSLKGIHNVICGIPAVSPLQPVDYATNRLHVLIDAGVGDSHLVCHGEIANGIRGHHYARCRLLPHIFPY